MSEWWIFPPPRFVGGQEKLDNNKRQLVSFPYQVGDEVLVMIPQKKKQKKQIHGEKIGLGGSTAPKDQTFPNGSINHNTKNNNSNPSRQLTTILLGRVVKVTAPEEDVQCDADGTNIGVKNETNACRKNAMVSSKSVVFVDIVPPSSSHTSTQQSSVISTITTTTNTPLCFHDKEQQRWLQPRFQPTKGDDQSNVPVVVLVQETTPFRKLIEFQLYQDNLDYNNKDRILEIGCSTGELSKRIWKMGVGAWVGIDTSMEMVNTCSQQLERYININIRSNYNVLRVDPMLEPQRAYKETIKLLGGVPTVVCLDIGGNREICPVMDVLSWVFRMFVESNSPDTDATDDKSKQPLRLILVKSRALVRCMLQDRANGTVRIDYSTGMINHGYDWFETAWKHGRRMRPEHDPNRDTNKRTYSHQTLKRITHPAKAPLACSPIDDRTPICRYHNYHPKGCKKRNYTSSPCEFDHVHCHSCRKPGHIALECTEECCHY